MELRDLIDDSPIDVAGTARERGRAHGEALRERIALGLALWREHAGVAPDTAGYVSAAKRWTPNVLEELAGIAEGAAVPFERVLAYNLGDELRLFDPLGHCTSVALRGETGGVPVSGQTMDTPSWFAELRVAIRSREAESGLTTVAFTIAGVVALCGANSAGLGVWCNALSQLPARPDGVPVSCIVRELLSQPSLSEARAFVRRVPHASGQHYLLAAPDGMAALECSAAEVTELRPGERAVWHTNHPLTAIGRSDHTKSRSSRERATFARRALATATCAEDLRALLANRTVPVAKTAAGGGDAYTLWAVVVEHVVPPRVAAVAGPPEPARWGTVDVVA